MAGAAWSWHDMAAQDTAGYWLVACTRQTGTPSEPYRNTLRGEVIWVLF